jgi:hypothetical protein
MTFTPKRIIAVIVSLAVLSLAYFGSYLPLRKAQMFIATLQGLQTSPATTLQDLETRISLPLDYPSPIGQEELVRNAGNSVLSFVQQNTNASATIELVNYLTMYYQPLIDRGTGMSFGQDLYLMGAVNEIAFARTGSTPLLAASQKYYEQAVALGPDRPQALYGLFDVYRAEGNLSSSIAIGNHILTNWPTDLNVRNALSAFLGKATGTKTK